MEAELNHILTELDMSTTHRDFRWLKEVILLAVHHPDTWQVRYVELIGKRECITRERVRQILYKAVWDHWTPRSVHILSEHLGHPVQTKFKYVKPNHIEFITLLAEELQEKHRIRS